jgi:hypothetical protein
LDWNSLLNAAVNGLFVGAGSTIGTYLVTRHFIRNLERLEELVKEKAKLEKEANDGKQHTN